MRISRFNYDGHPRVAVEHQPVNGGLFTTQLSPVRGPRTFKPGKMFATTKVVGLSWLYWYCRYKVGL